MLYVHVCVCVCLQAALSESFSVHVTDGGPVEGFCGWFDVWFKYVGHTHTHTHVYAHDGACVC